MQELPYPETDPNQFKVFAKALLEGEVFPALKSVVPHLVAKPTILTKTWTQERIVVMLAALSENEVCQCFFWCAFSNTSVWAVGFVGVRFLSFLYGRMVLLVCFPVVLV